VVGDAGLLIAAGNPVEVGRQLMSPPSVPVEVRADRAKCFSWTGFGEAYEAELFRIAQARQERQVANLG
jgi:hypothetical protein